MKFQKQIILYGLSLLSIFCAKSTLAQTTFRARLSSGLNVFHGQFDDKKNTGSYLTTGLGAALNITLSDALGLQPELSYLTNPGAPFRYNSISVPVLLVYKVGSQFEIEVGPSLQRDFMDNTYSYTASYTPYLNLGLNGGASYLFHKNLALHLRYTFEAFRTKYNIGIYSNNSDDPLLSGNSEPSFRDTFITASLQYSFR